jgi:hypothetical protein
MWRLQVVISVATLLYLILRRAEGDFRALFAVALGLFVATEGVGAIARGYGFITLNELAKPLNVSLFIFSSLAITAAVADMATHAQTGGTVRRQCPPLVTENRSHCLRTVAPGRRDPYRAVFVVAVTGFMFLAALRGAMEMRGHELNETANKLLSAVLGCVVVGVAAALFRGEMRARSRARGGVAQVSNLRHGEVRPGATRRRSWRWCCTEWAMRAWSGSRGRRRARARCWCAWAAAACAGRIFRACSSGERTAFPWCAGMSSRAPLPRAARA